MILNIFLIFCGLLAIGGDPFQCVDGVNNVIVVNSVGNETLPVAVENVTLHVYDINMKPSCHRGKVNVVMPGYFVIKGGEVRTKENLWVMEDSNVSVTIVWDDRELCMDGKSSLFVVPDAYCVFGLNTMLPENVTRVLQNEGVHTLEELETKINFNPILEIPESPSILFLSLIDMLRGQYKFKVSITSNFGKIVEFALPGDMTRLKLGLLKEDSDNFSNRI